MEIHRYRWGHSFECTIFTSKYVTAGKNGHHSARRTLVPPSLITPVVWWGSSIVVSHSYLEDMDLGCSYLSTTRQVKIS